MLISTIEAGKLDLTLKYFSINQVVDDVLTLLADEIETKNLDIKRDIKLEQIYSDIKFIRQILLNLIGNAVKFTNSGEVKITIYEKKHKYLIEIHDTGIGIKENDYDVIFESFSQLEKTSTRKHGGMGLGLSVCKKLINMLGGWIWVESEHNKGSTFYVSLPAS